MEFHGAWSSHREVQGGKGDTHTVWSKTGAQGDWKEHGKEPWALVSGLPVLKPGGLQQMCNKKQKKMKEQADKK